MFTQQGNAAGFTGSGETVVGYYRRGSKCWRVEVVAEGRNAGNPTDDRCRNFPTKRDAESYAAGLIDQARTEELKWW